MAINYTWNILNLHVSAEPQPETVTRISGYLYGENENGTNTTTDFNVNLPSPSEDFTPYQQLSKEQVTGWIESIMPEEAVAALKATIAKTISSLENPEQPLVFPDDPTLPWKEEVQHTVFYAAPDAIPNT
jgi:hypothetical protein